MSEAPNAADAGARFDPDAWWTFGEAADLAGVPHRTVAAWARDDRVSVRAAWREGAEIRLVRAGDVAEIVPAARDRALDARRDLGARGVFTGPRRSGLGSSSAVQDLGTGPASDLDASEAPPASSDEAGWRTEVEREIQRLRDELREVREERESLRRALDASREGERRGDDEERRVGDVDARAPGRRPGLVAVALACLAIGALIGRVSVPSPAAAAAGGALDLADEIELPRSEPPFPEPEHESASTPVPLEPKVANALRWSLPISLRTVEAGREPAVVDAPACAYAERVDGDDGAAEAFGPCFGPRTTDDRAVAGTHRVAGTPCCRHHAFVERMRGAATDEAAFTAVLAEARQAALDGLVPPLLELRAERSAVRFLDAALGGWTASGLDGAPASGDGSLEHRWRRRESEGVEPMRLALTSWVVHGPSDDRRSFRMILELSDRDAGDTLTSFEWLDD